jgi:potassium-dependent mechanosensitive channel
LALSRPNDQGGNFLAALDYPKAEPRYRLPWLPINSGSIVSKLSVQNIVASLLLLTSVTFGRADTASPLDGPRGRLDAARASLDQIESSLVRADLSQAALQSLRAQLEPIATGIQTVLDQLVPKQKEVKTRLEQLGPKPDDKALAENPGMTVERGDQDRLFEDIDGLVRRARVLQVQTDQLQTTIGARRHELFTRALLERGASIFSPALWADVARELPRDVHAVKLIAGDWLDNSSAKLEGWARASLTAILVLIGLLYWPLVMVAHRVMRRGPASQDPSRLQKAIAALWTAVGTAVIPMFALAAAGFALDAFALLSPRLEPIGQAIIYGVARVAVTIGIAQGLLAPGLPNWRLLNLSDPVVEKLKQLAIAVAVVMSSTKFIEALNDVIAASLTASIATRGIGALVIALLMAGTLKGIVDDPDEEGVVPRLPLQRDWYGPMRLSAWTAIIVIVCAVVVGYIALGAFLADQIAWVTGVGCLLFVTMILSDEAIAAAFQPHALLGRAIMSGIGLRRDSLGQIGILLSGATALILIVGAIMLLLAPWGIESNDMLGYLRAAFFGIRIGDVTVSVSSIIVSVLLFFLCFLVTRAGQRWLEVKFLPQTQLDEGLRNSIKTSLGYVGITVAASLSLSHLGLSFEKLAIVAGALSVGIGFGLQSIVSNFVSGLIILWERAIRVGDWIVVGDEQGYVRRINVRATEIETFDRATVIVPNSSLVIGVVKNWVRTDRVGRIKIGIGVQFDVDPDRVRDILVACAKANEFVLSIPAPAVIFVGFGESALQFELICFVDDVETAARVKSDLNFDIFRKIKEAGIEVPYPHRNIKIIGLEQLEALLARTAGPAETPSPVRKRS